MSAFDIKKVAMFFPQKNTSTTGFAYCERVTASPTSPHHIRKLTEVGVLKGGGADTPALCGTTVAWDTSEIESLFSLERMQSASSETNRLCQQCLHAARLVLETAEG